MKNREKIIKNNKQNISEWWDNSKQPHVCAVGVTKKEGQNQKYI